MLIQSLLDSDLYKYTMQEVVWNHFANISVEYAFHCRTEGVGLSPYADEIREELHAHCCLGLTDDEAAYLKSIRYLKPSYIDALSDLRLNPSHVQITTHPDLPPAQRLQVRITGNWFQTILFEVPLLAIINQVYFRHTQPDDAANRVEGMKRLEAKIARLKAADFPVALIDFGTRRRYSRDWHRTVLTTLQTSLGPQLLGTSNVALARELGLKPHGTMAHEFLQACQTLVALPDFQRFTFDTWMQEYRGDLGIALSDVVGMDGFLRDFDKLFCKPMTAAARIRATHMSGATNSSATTNPWGLTPEPKRPSSATVWMWRRPLPSLVISTVAFVRPSALGPT